MKRRWIVAILVAGAIAAVVFEPTGLVRGFLRNEPFFAGRPASTWASRLHDSNPQIVAESWRVLKKGGAEAVPVLTALTQSGTSSWDATPNRVAAIKMLEETGSPAQSATPALLSALHDADPSVRAAAAEALGSVAPQDERVINALIAMLGDSEARSAARGLVRCQDAARVASSKLIELLKSPGADLRWNAAKTLGKIHAVDALVPLIELLHDPDDAVREHAAEALGDLGPAAASAVEPLIRTLSDPYTKARRDAARSLGQIGPAAKAAIPALQALARDDKEEMVRQAAAAAVKRLGD